MDKVLFMTTLLSTIVAIVIFTYWRRRRKLAAYKLPPVTKFLLSNYVPFYNALEQGQKEIFEERMRDFLARTRVTGIAGVVVFDVDRVFIAAAAVMPLFGHKGWRYNNLDEILLYPGVFNRHYDTEGPGRDVLGLVGEGTLHRSMILSQQALRAGFMYPDNAHNTAIHEFVHLIDKADGTIDGVPKYLLDDGEDKSWKGFMQVYIDAIKQGYTDINPYGATNEAEFFAVVSEYYFKQPLLLQQQYPALYQVLHKMYYPKAA